ncbi:grasp-with-spasm system SPASM domain peptide maturase [Fulvivirgaceae bacterium BMA12]|uniref:Grasp-with-spasm system SPASM domain peptide maturase n=1 Tax=Agaribacillus aureus TaxID=3051825 RepID=A0ABT8KZV6_9BACT|nr:grasp-with-spasm system SPASM domain peptide maturase [Fulvivirgaceae bacterium BMA12]
MNNHFVLFSCCRLVKGASRSLIADSQRRSLDLIPNILAEIIEQHQGKTVDEIIAVYGGENAAFIKKYFSFLEEKEYIFYTTKDRVKYFPPLTTSWEYPGLLTNAIIDYGKKTAPHFEKMVRALDAMNCFAVQLRFFSEIDKPTLERVLTLFDKTRIADLQLLLTDASNGSTNDTYLKDLLGKFLRIGSLNVFNADKEKTVDAAAATDSRKINYHSVSFHPENVSYEKTIEGFQRNNHLNVFNESHHFNLYFNKKIYINEAGEIKNAPHTEEVFGNVETDKMIEVVHSPDFQKYWKVKKDDIEICKDCEFRYMCVDPRIPIEGRGGNYYFEIPCNYDPYAASWHENEAVAFEP